MDAPGFTSLGNDEVHSLRAGRLDVRSRRVEVGVVRDDLSRTGDDREEDPLRGTTLVRRDDVAEGKELAYRIEEAEPRRRARVALIAVLDRGPLVSGHRAGPGIREQIDQHVLRSEREEVVAGVLDLGPALFLGRQAKGLDGMDAEGLDDRAEFLRHRAPML